MKPRIIAVTALAAALTACGTPTVTSTPDSGEPPVTAQNEQTEPEATEPAEQKTAQIGDVITLVGSDETLKIAVKLNKVFPSAQPKDTFIGAGDGNEFYGVELILKNVGTVAYDDSPANGTVVIDDEGQQYGATLADLKHGVSLNSTTIAPGDVRKGVIAFAVTKGAKIVKLQMGLNSGFADQKGEWTIK